MDEAALFGMTPGVNFIARGGEDLVALAGTGAEMFLALRINGGDTPDSFMAGGRTGSCLLQFDFDEGFGGNLECFTELRVFLDFLKESTEEEDL